MRPVNGLGVAESSARTGVVPGPFSASPVTSAAVIFWTRTGLCDAGPSLWTKKPAIESASYTMKMVSGSGLPSTATSMIDGNRIE